MTRPTPKKRRPIEIKKVWYQRNIDLGIDPYCHECVSHAMDDSGYITLVRDGFYRMHRWLYWKKTGEKPEVVLHLCDNRKCINTAHLKGGTVADNNTDMDSKGRSRYLGAPKGNKWNRSFSTAQIRAIRNYRAKGWSNERIAKVFHVSAHAISEITSSKRYSDIR
jgi:hypothetical protein